jgi:hypothetical protein
VESAAVRDISEASVYVGMYSPVAFVGHFLMPYDRLPCTKTVSQNCLLCVVRYPLAWCVPDANDCLRSSRSAFCSSCPCTISRWAEEPCSTSQGPMEGRQESESCSCCRGGSQGGCKGDSAIADARCFVIARYLYHAFKDTIKRFLITVKGGMKLMKQRAWTGVITEWASEVRACATCCWFQTNSGGK